MRGSWMSLRMRSGCSRIVHSSSSSPAVASINSYPFAGTTSRTVWRLSSWSSMTRMRLLIASLLAVDASRQFDVRFDPYRQTECERRALADGRFHPDFSAMHLDDLSGNGQSQAAAPLGAR